MGNDADRAHGRGQLARPEHHRHAGRGAGTQGQIRTAAGGQPGRRGGDAGAAATRTDKLALLADIQPRLRRLPERGKHHRARPAVRQGAARRTGRDCWSGCRRPPARRQERRPGVAGRSARRRCKACSTACRRGPTRPLPRNCRTSNRHLAGDLAEDLHRLREVSTPRADHAGRPAGRPARALRRPTANGCCASSPRMPVGLRAAGAFHRADPDGRSGGDRQAVRHGGRVEGDEERPPAGRALCLSGDRGGAVLRLPQLGAHADRR